VEFVKDADAVLFFIGSMQSEDTEMMDRRDAKFNPNYELVMDWALKLGKKIIVVIQSGSAMIMGDWEKKAKAIVQMWLGGEACGGAIANVLFGKVNPSGKLSETFAKHSRTDIDYPGDGYKVCYDEKWRVGYRYYDLNPDEVWFPFGFGLSYTTFSYSNLKIVPKNDGFTVKVDVENCGNCVGSEVVQLYVSDRVSTVSKPYKELINFDKIEINPGEKRTVEFNVCNSELSYYNTVLKKWITEPGVYDILIGASAADIRLRGEYTYDADSEYTIKYNAEQIMG
jgi:beta-glucosidase